MTHPTVQEIFKLANILFWYKPSRNISQIFQTSTLFSSGQNCKGLGGFHTRQRRISNPVKHLRWKFFVKKVKGF